MNKYLKWSNIWILIIVGLSVIIMASQLLSDANAVQAKRTEDGYRILEYFEKKEIKDKTAPIGKRYEYTKLIEKMPPQSSGIVFCAVHQNVSVYLDKELVYEVTPPKRSVFGKSPGTNWVIVPLYQSDKGKTLKIVMTPIYEQFAGVLPTIYYGSPTKILIDFLRQKMIPVVLCAIIFTVGTVFLGLGLWNYKNSQKGIDIVMIGLFSMILALWRSSDYSLTKLFVQNARAVTTFTLVLVMFLAPTFLVYTRCLFSDKSHKLWSIVQYVTFGAISVSLVFQLLGIADLRQTLWLHHMTLIMTALLVAYMIFREVKLYGMNQNMKVIIVGIGICIFSFVSDLIAFYRSPDGTMTSWALIAFIVYIGILGFESLRNTASLMHIASQAQHYEKMAYHDELTGFYNRSAYADHTGMGFSPEGHIIVMCDLNNLKKCNDTHGHEQGDLYIKSSAELLEKIFGKYGKCYRMGGDEFTIVLKNLSLESVRIKEDIIADRCQAYNEEHPDRFPMNIACGYAMFDPDEDTDITDTARRADKMMYIHKFMMKGELGR